jgi:hypothetical protein
MITKRFKNGNINVKLEKDETIKESLLIDLLNELYYLDCTLFGEEYCISNYDMAIDVYSYYDDVLIRIIYSDLDKLKEGKTIKLYARKLDKYDRELYKQLEENGEI